MTKPTEKGVKAGLRVLVTAGAAGIGRAIADAFAAREARVYVCDISREAVEKCRAEQPGIIATEADVADEAAIDRLFDDVQARLGGLDVLVNTPGLLARPAKWRTSTRATGGAPSTSISTAIFTARGAPCRCSSRRKTELS
jgi:NAD(P)-dependent dehydrogenase (short-subunit alcohol dehydrogenase family)